MALSPFHIFLFREPVFIKASLTSPGTTVSGHTPCPPWTHGLRKQAEPSCAKSPPGEEVQYESLQARRPRRWGRCDAQPLSPPRARATPRLPLDTARVSPHLLSLPLPVRPRLGGICYCSITVAHADYHIRQARLPSGIPRSPIRPLPPPRDELSPGHPPHTAPAPPGHWSAPHSCTALRILDPPGGGPAQSRGSGQDRGAND